MANRTTTRDAHAARNRVDQRRDQKRETSQGESSNRDDPAPRCTIELDAESVPQAHKLSIGRSDRISTRLAVGMGRWAKRSAWKLPLAPTVVVFPQDEARLLGHNYIGTAPAPSRSPPELRRCSSWHCARRCRSTSTTSAPSTSCWASLRERRALRCLSWTASTPTPRVSETRSSGAVRPEWADRGHVPPRRDRMPRVWAHAQVGRFLPSLRRIRNSDAGRCSQSAAIQWLQGGAGLRNVPPAPPRAAE
jgi:hypothetical protein